MGGLAWIGSGIGDWDYLAIFPDLDCRGKGPNFFIGWGTGTQAKLRNLPPIFFLKFLENLWNYSAFQNHHFLDWPGLVRLVEIGVIFPRIYQTDFINGCRWGCGESRGKLGRRGLDIIVTVEEPKNIWVGQGIGHGPFYPERPN